MTEDIEQLRQSRDEAIAELNKALETLGQVRSDLQKAEEARGEVPSDAAIKAAKKAFRLSRDNDREPLGRVANCPHRRLRAIDGDFNAGIEMAARHIEQDGDTFVKGIVAATEIRKLKR